MAPGPARSGTIHGRVGDVLTLTGPGSQVGRGPDLVGGVVSVPRLARSVGPTAQKPILAFEEVQPGPVPPLIGRLVGDQRAAVFARRDSVPFRSGLRLGLVAGNGQADEN